MKEINFEETMQKLEQITAELEKAIEWITALSLFQ